MTPLCPGPESALCRRAPRNSPCSFPGCPATPRDSSDSAGAQVHRRPHPASLEAAPDQSFCAQVTSWGWASRREQERDRGSGLSQEERVKVIVAQSCLTLCDPMDCSPSDSSVHGILQARRWSGLPFPPPGDPSNPGVEPGSPASQADWLSSEPPGKPKQRQPSRFQAEGKLGEAAERRGRGTTSARDTDGKGQLRWQNQDSREARSQAPWGPPCSHACQPCEFPVTKDHKLGGIR